MLVGDACPRCLTGTLQSSICDGQVACDRCSMYYDDTSAQPELERSVARVNDPDGNEHKIVFIRVGDYWEVE